MKGLYSRRQRCIPVIHDTIKYDAIRYFTLRSEADTSQLNLPHETKKIIEWKYENKKTDMLRSNGNSGVCEINPEEEQERLHEL